MFGQSSNCDTIFLRREVKGEEIRLEHFPTEDQVTNVLTKGTVREKQGAWVEGACPSTKPSGLCAYVCRTGVPPALQAAMIVISEGHIAGARIVT
jgi:hypothetical protein